MSQTEQEDPVVAFRRKIGSLTDDRQALIDELSDLGFCSGSLVERTKLLVVAYRELAARVDMKAGGPEDGD